jgi:ATP synthase protein I
VSRLLKRREDTPSERRALWRDASNALTLGWNLALPIFGGALIGYLIDRWLKSSPIFFIGFIVLGIGAGFYSYFKTISRLESSQKTADEKKDERTPK